MLIDQVGIRNYPLHIYRTKNGLHYFQFQYKHQTDSPSREPYYEIVIVEQPSYQDRNSGSITTHRLPSSEVGKKKICIKTNKLIQATGTLDKARALSIAWAEMTSKYILTGKTIDQQIAS